MTKYLHAPIDPDMRRQMIANLAKLPRHLRFRGKSNLQCDFCSNDDPQWVFAANRLTSGEPRKCWRWLACNECRDLIAANNWDGLYERSAKGMGAPGDLGKAKATIGAVMMAFRTDATEET